MRDFFEKLFKIKAIVASFLFIMSILPLRSVALDSSDSAQPQNVEVRAASSSKFAAKAVQVIDVYKLGHEDEKDKERNFAGIGDIIVIKVRNLKSLLDRAKCLDSNGREKPAGECKKQEVRLFLDGRMIREISPESGAPQEDEGELQFHLQRNSENDEAWADIFGAPKLDRNFSRRPTKISIGLENEYAEDSIIESFNLTRVKKNWFWVAMAVLLLYAAALIVLVAKSNLLRDRGINASAVGVSWNPKAVNPFSLGRFQMAFWFSLVIASFLFIWLITGAHDIITASILGLIGISAGTSLSAAVIDNNKAEELIKQTSNLQAEQAALQNDIAKLNTQLNAVQSPSDAIALTSVLNTNQVRMNQIQTELSKNLASLKPKTSQGFLLDLLSDANGVSFHRLQMFVWTLILGVLFVYSVWARLSMPEFSATLLALQGITAGTYLGFKIPEKQA